MTLYEYGPAAWLWRLAIAVFLTLASVFLFVGLFNPFLLLGALALIAPAIFFGLTVVVRCDRWEEDGLDVRTLLFVRRRIPRDRLGVPRVRRTYQSLHGNLSAPRVWVPVRGELPIYFDLLGRMPDRQALLAALKITAAEIRRAE